MVSEIDLLIKDIVSQLQARSETISVAESCTGGMLSAYLTNPAGVSSVYMGGVVSYANAAKESLLQVPADLLLNHGAVSKEVALSMAKGVRRVLRTSWSVAITGIAGPTGGTPDKPVGTVCFAVCGPGFERIDVQRFSGDRAAVRLASATHAARLLKQSLTLG
jgi:PncC family amidohydrolase